MTLDQFMLGIRGKKRREIVQKLLETISKHVDPAMVPYLPPSWIKSVLLSMRGRG